MMMKLLIATAALSLIITAANAKSDKSHAGLPPHDRYFDAAHGPDDPHGLWIAGDYVGRDPDPTIRASMIKEFLQGIP